MRSRITMPFGKHKGQPLSALTEDYLDWLLRECNTMRPWLREAVRRELNDRIYGDVDDDPPPRPRQGQLVDVPAIVGRARRELAMRYHPDRGGSKDLMAGINVALDRVQELAGVA